MKGKLIVLLSVLMVLVLVLGACGTKTTTVTTTTSSTTTSTSTTTTVLKPIEIVFAHTTPAQAALCVYLKQITDEITAETDGMVTFTFYWSNSLMPQDEIPKGIQNGVCDMAYFPVNFNFCPLSAQMLSLPFMGIPSPEVGTDLWWQLYDKYTQVQDEWDGIKIMAVRMYPAMQLHTTGKEVRVPADLQGMKLISAGETAKVMNAAGATPVEVGVQDLYMSLNSGMTSGIAQLWPVINIFGVQSLLPYHANWGEGGIELHPDAILMNPAKFNSMPAEWQTIFVEKFTEYQAQAIVVDAAEVARAMKEADEAGHTTVWLTAEEIEQWAELATPFHYEWIEKMEGMGKTDAGAIYEEAMNLIAAAQ